MRLPERSNVPGARRHTLSIAGMRHSRETHFCRCAFCEPAYDSRPAARNCRGNCQSSRGGIGRRVRLRTVWGNPWRFESSREHHLCKTSDGSAWCWARETTNSGDIGAPNVPDLIKLLLQEQNRGFLAMSAPARLPKSRWWTNLPLVGACIGICACQKRARNVGDFEKATLRIRQPNNSRC